MKPTKTLLISLLAAFCFMENMSAQNISINTSGAANTTLSMLEVLQLSTTANSAGLYSAHSGAISGTGYGLYVTKTGASTNNTGGYFNASGATTNMAGYFTATGGTNNYAIIVPSGGGRVGIGTITPTAALNVDAGSGDAGPWVTLQGGGAVFGNTGLRFWDLGTAANNENVIEFGHNSTFVSAARIKSLNPSNNATTGGKLYLETASNNTGTFNTNQVVLSNNGNVGIGTATPFQKLDVRGIAMVNGGNLYGSENNYLTTGALNVGDYNRNYGGGSAWNANSAGLLLECLDNTEVAVHDNGTRIASMLYFEGAGTNRLRIGRDMGWGTLSTISMWGNVGVDVLTPFSKLDVNGGVAIGSYAGVAAAPANGLIVSGSLGVGTSNPLADFGEIMEVYGGNLFVKNPANGYAMGFLGIGTTSTGLIFRKDGTRHAGMKWDGRYLQLMEANISCCLSDVWGGTAATTWDIATGYVGISSNTPPYPLTIGQTGNMFGVENTAIFLAKNSAGTYEQYFWPRWNDDIMYMNYGSGGFNIRDNGGFRVMFFTPGANVGVHRSDAAAELHVNSTFFVGDRPVGTNQALEVYAGGGDVHIGSDTQEGDLFVRDMAGTANVHFSGASGNYINSGNLGLGTTSPSAALHVFVPDNTVGQIIQINAASASITSADDFIQFRNSAGTVIGAVEGTITAGQLVYTTFTGSHYTIIDDREGLEANVLLESTGEKFDEGQGQLVKARICTTRQSKAAYGVYGGTNSQGKDLVLSMGTGYIWVANKGQNIEVGDLLISSDVKGCSEKQDDDLMHGYSVAKAQQPILWEPGEVKRLIACIYLGG